MNCSTRIIPLIAIFIATGSLAATASCQQADKTKSADLDQHAQGIAFFEAKIRPVLIRECYGCHAKKTGQSRGGLQVDTKMGMLLGGDSGAAIVPGNPEDSPLWSAINYEDYAMPPNQQLSPEIIEDFRQWIEMGAPDPRSQTKTVVNATITQGDIKQGKQFWSFKRPSKPELPDVRQVDWPRNEIDQFVLAKLESRQLAPAPDAEPRTLLRRLCFDLIGLPPTPEQIDWFLPLWQNDPDAAVAAAVDYLLESERYGERWARHWLDVARYAESSGKELNATFPHAWRYRDYVIDAFNNDKPYDRFIQEQVAGDLLPVNNDEQWAEHLVATGFLTLGPKTLTEQNPRQFRMDLVDEQIDVTTRVVLGVSVACARCHDHKFDPIPQSDYYAMAGIFLSTNTYYGTLDTRQNRRPSNLLLLPISDVGPNAKSISQSELAALRNQLEEVRADYREALLARRRSRRDSDSNQDARSNFLSVARASAQIGAIESLLESFDRDGNPRSFCMGVQSSERPINAQLLARGEVDQPGPEIPRGFVQVLTSGPTRISKSSTGRLELANWLTDDANPLTARVMVNRVWKHLFGAGIVETTENFGATGTPPSHPQLLDYLAVRFVENGWSIKQLIRDIANSHAYRVSSRFDKDSFELDPDNRLLWRATPKRLDAEVIRDAMLSISQDLSVERPRSSEVARAGQTIVRDGSMRNLSELLLSRAMDGDNRQDVGRSRSRRERRRRSSGIRNEDAAGTETDPVADYRSIYLPIVRDNIPRSLAVFDFAEASMVVGRRETSNTPDQALYFMNNSFVIQRSEAWAEHLREQASDVPDQIQLAFLMAFGRDATDSEMTASLSFLDSFQATGRSPELQKLSALCQAIMASAEFRILN